MAKNYNDSNTMSSTLFSFVRKHWYASIKAVAVYVILYFCTFSLVNGTGREFTVYWIISGLCCVMFCFFSYMDTWRKAMRDHNLVMYNYIQYNKWRGLLSGLLADIPGLVIIIFILITKASGASNYVDFAKVGYFILYSPFVMLVTALEGPTHNLIYFLPLIVTPITGAAGYYFGYRNIGLVGQFIYKTDRAKNKKLR